MEFNSRKKFILAAGIIYVVFGVLNLIISLVFLCNENFFEVINEYVAQYMEYYTSTQIEMIDIVSIMKGTFIVSLVFGLLSVVFGVYFIVISKKWSEEVFLTKKTQYIVLTIISFLLCGNFLTLIFLLLALYSKNGNATAQVATNNINEENENKKMLDEIEKLKNLKDSGALTDEEYTELLSKIIK